MARKRIKPNWFNIGFIGLNTLIAAIGCPIYLYHYGITPAEIALLVFFSLATGFSITVGYHRLFSHATYKANTFVRFLLLYFGAAAFEQSALAWSSQHRDHHQYVDTERDPYNIKKGFFWAHMGWLIYGKNVFFYDNVDDLIRSKLIMHQARHYFAWGIVAGIVTPVLIGAMMGHALGAFLFSVCFRVTLVYHSTWCINSVCHTFGNRTYDINSSSRDHWLVAILTFGEGYHNFHHRFPSDYRNGVRWHHFDPSKWIIFFLEKIGFAWDVKRVSDFRILDARLSAENQGAKRTLLSDSKIPNLETALQEKYAVLRRSLINWEDAVKEYHQLLRDRVTKQSAEFRQSALVKVQETRQHFLEVREQWKRFLKKSPSSFSHSA